MSHPQSRQKINKAVKEICGSPRETETTVFRKEVNGLGFVCKKFQVFVVFHSVRGCETMIRTKIVQVNKKNASSISCATWIRL